MPLCCFPRVFLSSQGVEEPLVARLVHGSSLLSPWFLRGLEIQELLSGGELLLPVMSRLALPPQLCTLGEVLGRESFSRVFFLCSRLPLPPHLCTLSEVVGRVGRPSAAPVRVLPGLPILGYGSQECLSPLLVDWLSCPVLLLTLSLCFPCAVSGRDAVCMDHLVCWLTLCGHCAIVGGLRTASAFTAFAQVVSVWPVAVFRRRSGVIDSCCCHYHSRQQL